MKPRACFEVERILGVSNDGSYQVQWSPSWVSKFHLVGCEHLIEDFLQRMKEKNEGNELNDTQQQDEEEVDDGCLGLAEEPLQQPQIEIQPLQQQKQPQPPQEKRQKHNQKLAKLNHQHRHHHQQQQQQQKQQLQQRQQQPQQEHQNGQILYDLTSQQQQNEINEHMDIELKFGPVEELNEIPTMIGSDERDLLPYSDEMDIKLEDPELEPVPYETMGQLLHRYDSSESYSQSDEFRNSRTTMCSPTTKDEQNVTNHHNRTVMSSGGIILNDIKAAALKCRRCGQSFASASNLEDHEQQRTCEKRFSCSYCDYSCNRRGNLEKHVRVHTGEKPYKCEICGSCFKATSDLNVHMLRHKGEYNRTRKR